MRAKIRSWERLTSSRPPHIGGYSYIDLSLSAPIAATGIDLRVGR